MRFDQLGPILDVEGCAFYSLQAGPSASQNDGRAVGLVKYCHDFADTAAAIANLDIVITVDTAVAHLASAMGKPCWILLAKNSDWRWGLGGSSTAWYPGVTLIRASFVNWGSAIADTAERLRFDLRAGAGRTAEVGHMRQGGVESPPPRSEPHDDASCVQIETPDSAVNPAISAFMSVDAGLDHSPIITRTTRYGELSWFRNDTYIGRALELYGEYSQSESDLFRRVLKSGDVVIEAGANIGALTVALAEIVGPSGEVHAYEPQQKYFALLSANTQDERQVTCFDAALGSEAGPIVLQSIPTDRVHAPDWKGTGDDFMVEQITIDSLNLERLDFCKIDIDGGELEVLKGAVETIKRCRPVLYFEIDKMHLYPQILEWVACQGYRLYQHNPPLFNPANFANNPVNVFGRLISAMALAIPMERKDLRLDTLGPDLQRMREII